ncbi:PotD/PotF family extracellular solute-binding protein [Lyngbya sp. PCC 8106]|uniref:ABC transporter substrate-binding protein n=1 Tax=Lyngbya sp. (strain PCC 8106) TaxID=313612 RepID=UPI0000EAB144|nr:spermidine/putrescine ABC transporter substrate-binding protein [Lyngbya sp. PCC 8106]EAW39211.1 spermidine/putrescine ABC transporter spermidine/putrescine-binding protein [Lyngbya sp. PCC 8106]
MKRLLTFILLFLISVLLPIGCTVSNSNLSQSGQTGDNILNIYNWSTYIAPEVLTQFEDEYNVKINYDTYDSNESLYAKLKPGNPGYDIAFPADYMVKVMIAENLLEKVDKNNISNLNNIDEKFLNPPYDPQNQYSIPYQWLTMGIGYNIKVTQAEINSWAALFDPKFAGKAALLDDMRHTFGAVLIYLGYNPNTTNPEEIEKAKEFLIKNQKNIKAFVPDTGQNLLNQGEIDLTMEYSGDLFQVMAENPDLRYVIPQEGTLVAIDSMVIPKNAPHKQLAEQFINFILEPEIGAKVSNFINYASPNKIAIQEKLIKAENLENPGIYPSPEVFAKLQYLEDVGEATILYDEAWNEVKLNFGT